MGEEEERGNQRRMNATMACFMSFHQSTLLRKAVLTAMAMQVGGAAIDELKQQFMRADLDGNGVISKEELAKAINLRDGAQGLATMNNLPDKGLANDVQQWFSKIFESVDTDVPMASTTPSGLQGRCNMQR